MTKNIRDKGHAFERELAAYINSTTGLEASRTCLTQSQFDASQGNCDLIGTPSLAIEAKRVERLNFPEAFRQAQRNSEPHEIPVVINRRNRQPTGESYCLLKLDDFLKLYTAYLKTEGHTPCP
jgi:hypothetical protein